MKMIDQRDQYEAALVWDEAHLMNASPYIGRPGVYYQGTYHDGERGDLYALYVLNVGEKRCSVGAHYGIDPERPGDYLSGMITEDGGIYTHDPALLTALVRFFVSGLRLINGDQHA
jgi:hypothetical protein